MGVKGLWKVIERAGRPITPESLAGQRLAVDISIWIYQLVRALPSDASRDRGYSPLVLMGLVRRILRLLYFGIKPVMVFDGSAPALKSERLVSVRKSYHFLYMQKERSLTRSNASGRLRATAQKIFNARVKLILAGQAEEKSVRRAEDQRPVVIDEEEEDDDDDEYEDDYEDWLDLMEYLEGHDKRNELDKDQILDSLNLESEQFKNLPTSTQQAILIAMRERLYIQQHRQSSKPTPPTQSEQFSARQVETLVKRRKISEALEKAKKPPLIFDDARRKPVGGGQRIAADAGREFILVKNKDHAGWKFEPVISGSLRKEVKFEKPLKREEEDNFEALFFNDEGGEPKKALDQHFKSLDLPVPHEEILCEVKDEGILCEAKDDNVDVQEDSSNFEQVPWREVIDVEEGYRKDAIVMDSIEETLESHGASNETTIELEPYVQIEKPKIACLISIEDDSTEKPSELLENNTKIDSLLVKEEPIKRKMGVNNSVHFEEPELKSDYFGINPMSPETGQEATNVEELKAELAQMRRQVSREASKAMVALEGELIADLKAVLVCCGIPWVQAPFEAEAQCAWLARQGLVDGIVTDDSDVLLFGPGLQTPVYRHFSSSRSERRRLREATVPITLAYTLERIKKDTGFERWHLVSLALLLGGDYGNGVAGLGPVRSSAVVKGLSPSIDAESTEKDQISRLLKRLMNLDQEGPLLQSSLVALLAKLDLERPLAGWSRIVDAYYAPIIDENQQHFQWGQPNLQRLSELLCGPLRFSPERVDELLYPLRKHQ